MSTAGDVAILVPVKDLSGAKSRLAGLMTQPERTELAWRMLQGVLAQVARVPAPVRRVVVTSYPPAMERAGALGFQVLREARQVSESASVDAASAQLAAESVRGVLRVPLDLPLLATADLEALLAAIPPAGAEGRAVLLSPSRDGTGTNAIYRSPPTLFPSRFGPDSLRLHEAAARAATAAVRVLAVPGVALDIDDPADVAELLRRDAPCAARDFLLALGVPERLARQADAAPAPGGPGAQKR